MTHCSHFIYNLIAEEAETADPGPVSIKQADMAPNSEARRDSLPPAASRQTGEAVQSSPKTSRKL